LVDDILRHDNYLEEQKNLDRNGKFYSTVTLFARLRGLSTSNPLATPV
jgi:hypothetical protein